MDSTGIAECFRAVTSARTGGIDITIVRGPRAIQRVFQIAGLADQLPFVNAPDPLRETSR